MTPPADIIIENARVLTMDGAQPRAEAVALAEGSILAVGAPGRPSKPMPVSARERIDAGGASVLPGFIDSHIHLFAGGAQLEQPVARRPDRLRPRSRRRCANARGRSRRSSGC